MMEVTLELNDQITPLLKSLHSEAPKILDAALSGTARGYRDHALRYLRAMLRKQTGATQRQLRYYKRRDQPHWYVVSAPQLANIYEHNGGATIVPKKRGGMLRFTVSGRTVFAKKVHLKQRPFMSASFLTFDFWGTFEAKARAAIDRMLVKFGMR